MANISLKTMTFEGLDNIYKIPRNLDDLDGVLPTSKGGTGTNNLDEFKTDLDIPIVDTTLTVSGAAADAKAVGEALEDLQPKAITDAAGYFTTDTVEGALAEIGAELAGINTLIGSGVIT